MADETPAPLSDAELAAIGEHYFEPPTPIQWAEVRERITGKLTHLEYYDDAPYIVVRLLATLAAYREVVAAVANARGGGTSSLYLTVPDDTPDEEVADYALNLWKRARALLGMPPAVAAPQP